MDIQHFYITGINYKKTDVNIRGKFALNEEQYSSILQKANDNGLENVFVLSTCNRTEIYGVASSSRELKSLLCEEAEGDINVFEEISYTKKGKDAIEHLFSVASGLDSQILGDYEIVGQMKQAVRIAKSNGNIGAFMERLTNTVFESSKAIKNQTDFSGGTVSVAFAAIQFIKYHCTDISNQKILIIGTGKIGRNTCKNLVDYLGTKNITLINRSADKAKELADELQLQFAPYEQLYEKANEADIIVVATNAQQPVLYKNDLKNNDKKILIDLSIPNNIDVALKERPHTIMVNVDDLSKMNDATLQMREREIPKVKSIIGEYMDEFYDWYKMRRNAPFIRAAKKSLSDINVCPWYQTLKPEALQTEAQQEEAVQNAVKKLAVKMREQHSAPGCTYIEALHDFIAHHPEKSEA
ncbi:glutamyl-tRNA reductase [Arachidicoccus ginsenosidimutans]|uniref:glutamyl-tRNA reductase n=1 Tax=Arachidicoccus sp. BS20 TaxID=1850526 RepID=UPI0007F070EB|nr:glutamyl-tRNA reductase [Arachidicoccus sp. BS20]ANI89422.1 glutamyl-tRNA reductase [Arachidicoccus sp. BS20]